MDRDEALCGPLVRVVKQAVPLRKCRAVESPASEVAVVLTSDPRLMYSALVQQRRINVQGLVVSRELTLLNLQDCKVRRVSERGVLAALVVLVVAHRGSQAEAPCPITT